MHVEPGVQSKFSIPRIKGGTMLQKRKEQPEASDSKGGFTYSERSLTPHDFMAFTTFNPRSFESIWRKWQPKGNLVFSELPSEAQNALLAELSKCVQFELGDHFINGEYAASGDTHLFDGIVTRMAADNDKVVVSTSATTMIGRLAALKAAVPVWMRSNPGLRILMSVEDFDLYDDELSAQSYKGADYTDTNARRFKGIAIEPLANWPTGLLVATICGMDYDTNLWAGVNLVDDMDVIQIDKLTAAGELYFFKMLMKADTQIAFGEEVVWLDKRSDASTTLTITSADAVSAAAGAATLYRTVAVSDGSAFTVENDDEDDTWLTVSKSGNKVKIELAANTGAERTGSYTITAVGTSVTKTVTVTQASGL
ncbi:MAG: hypothetical protein K6F98_05670 [Bacteroidales bacterium]|nr:hypothetical protein [Bacteroidales bacterium]